MSSGVENMARSMMTISLKGSYLTVTSFESISVRLYGLVVC
jgi:hypothetical protein